MYTQPILLLTGRKHSLGLKQEGCWLLPFLHCSGTSVLFLYVQCCPPKRRAAETWHVAAQTCQLCCWTVWAAISGPGMCHYSPGHRTRDTLFITVWDARFRCLPLAPVQPGPVLQLLPRLVPLLFVSLPSLAGSQIIGISNNAKGFRILTGRKKPLINHSRAPLRFGCYGEKMERGHQKMKLTGASQSPCQCWHPKKSGDWWAETPFCGLTGGND